MKERYCFIKSFQNFYPVMMLCRGMQLSRSAYYQWLEAKTTDFREQQLEEKVLEAFQEHKRRYGIRRICAEIKGKGH